MGQMGINLQRVDAIYTFSEGGRSPELASKLRLMHVKWAAQTPLLEKVDVKTSPLGANGAINTLWREMLQALIGRKNAVLKLRRPRRAPVARVPGLRTASSPTPFEKGG